LNGFWRFAQNQPRAASLVAKRPFKNKKGPATEVAGPFARSASGGGEVFELIALDAHIGQVGV